MYKKRKFFSHDSDDEHDSEDDFNNIENFTDYQLITDIMNLILNYKNDKTLPISEYINSESTRTFLSSTIQGNNG